MDKSGVHGAWGPLLAALFLVARENGLDGIKKLLKKGGGLQNWEGVLGGCPLALFRFDVTPGRYNARKLRQIGISGVIIV
ncbi:MAG: hypothetical protein QM426_00505 [Euryarchaeota archaeon]|nr:hypothetical protein [Euryarchaeota archaeon]